jgi:hypothetical protein
MQAETHRRNRRAVAAHMVEEMGLSETSAEAVLAFYERDTGFWPASRHVSMQVLPILRRIAQALDKDVDPLCNCNFGNCRVAKQLQTEPAAAEQTCHCKNASRSAPFPLFPPVHQATQPYSKRLQPPGDRKLPCTGPQPDRFEPGQLGTFKAHCHAPKEPTPHPVRPSSA